MVLWKKVWYYGKMYGTLVYYRKTMVLSKKTMARCQKLLYYSSCLPFCKKGHKVTFLLLNY